MRAAVIQFPGSNADWDAYHALRDALGFQTQLVFHKEVSLPALDLIVIPGGFSYGDYLRAGAIARFSPIARAVVKAAQAGVPVLGICNGFQILTELGLLPGALGRNMSLRFVCKDVHLRAMHAGAFTSDCGEVLRMPVAHGEGRYLCDADTLKRLHNEGRIAFQYADREGNVSVDANPNGSVDNIAGIYDENRRVLGLMPHPERAASAQLGSADGLHVFRHLLESEKGNA